MTQEAVLGNYKVWDTNNGMALLEVGSLRPIIFEPSLYIVRESGKEEILKSSDNSGFAGFSISAAQVAELMASPTSTNPPSLLLLVSCIWKPGAPDRTWGWRTRISQLGTPRNARLDDGSPLALDAAGCVPTSIRKFPDNKNHVVGIDVITLA
jgi:hypothetical protein